MADAKILSLKPEPLTRERFVPYGDVIEGALDSPNIMNEARFQRFDDLCDVDLGDGAVSISIARCRAPTVLPLRIDMVERHPLGSQAFVPLKPCRMVVVVAPPGESVDADELRAFVTGQDFLIVDRGGKEANCDTHGLDRIVMLEAV